MSDPVKVACTNPQPLLLTGKPCGWTGNRTGRLVTTPTGGTFREDPKRKRCPKCGARVVEAPA
jgi:hypothetical protein